MNEKMPKRHKLSCLDTSCVYAALCEEDKKQLDRIEKKLNALLVREKEDDECQCGKQ